MTECRQSIVTIFWRIVWWHYDTNCRWITDSFRRARSCSFVTCKPGLIVTLYRPLCIIASLVNVRSSEALDKSFPHSMLEENNSKNFIYRTKPNFIWFTFNSNNNKSFALFQFAQFFFVFVRFCSNLCSLLTRQKIFPFVSLASSFRIEFLSLSFSRTKHFQIRITNDTNFPLFLLSRFN